MGGAPSMGSRYSHAAASMRRPSATSVQWVASPLNGQWVTWSLGSSRSVRTSSRGK